MVINLTHKWITFLSALIFLLLPWLQHGSGLFQPVDILILCLFPTVFLVQLPVMLWIVQNSKIYKIFLIFSGYTLTSLFINYIIFTEEMTLILMVQNIYFIFLLSLFLLMVLYFYNKNNSEKYYRLILLFLLLDCILPIHSFFKLSSLNDRISLTFNNPNQLGFFALINLSIFFYISLYAREQQIKIHKMLSIFIINFNLLFIFLSSSRACYPAVILYIISYFLIFKWRPTGYKFWLFWIGSGTLATTVFSYTGFALFKYVQQSRSLMISRSSSSLSTDIKMRAFHGITENFTNVWYFLFGNGSYTTSSRGGLEFHNNFIAILNQVGLIGFLLYFYLIISIAKELYKFGFLYLLPYGCYVYFSLFHYSYRTRINWLFLAFVIFIILHSKKKEEF